MTTNIFFFADPSKIERQTDAPDDEVLGHDEAFGPVLDSEDTQFRVTSLHKGKNGSNPAAYAVCKGRVRLQADGTGSTFTLVLAPDVEILRGLPLRFFIYRGIRRDSLFDDNTGKLVRNDLTKRLLDDDDPDNDNLDALGLAFRPEDDSPSEPEFAREDTDPIDTLFFENTELKPIPVAAGDELGTFDGTAFGFEIMLGTVWDPPALKQLRRVPTSEGNIIKVSTGNSQNLVVRQRAARERVYSYLDPCAFYGICSEKEGGTRIHHKVSDPLQTIELEKPQDTYDVLLIYFHNKNRIYIDLRNDNGLSYDYYDTYRDSSILLELDSGLLNNRKKRNDDIEEASAESYLTHKWPLKIIPASKFDVPPNESKAALRLAMNLGERPAERRVFFEFSYLYYSKNGVKKGDRLFKPGAGTSLADVTPDNEAEGQAESEWTKDVVLAIPAVTNDAGTRLPTSFYMRLRYFRQNEERPTNTNRYINTADQWDNLFIIKDDPERWANNSLTNWWRTSYTKYVEPALPNQQIYEGMVEVGVAVDKNQETLEAARYTFYYLPIYVAPEPKGYAVQSGPNVAGSSSSKNSFFQRKEAGRTYHGSRHLELKKISQFYSHNPNPLDDTLALPPSDPENYLNFLTFLENPEEPDPAASPNHSKESLYALSFSAAEYDALLQYARTEGFDRQLHPVFLQVKRRISPRNDNTATERAYQALELRLVGFDDTGNYHAFGIPATGPDGILPLSLPADGIIYCTNDAADFEPIDISWDYAQICVQVRHDSMAGDDEGHESDFRYFGRAIADIKRYHPEFFQRMDRLQRLGADVTLPLRTIPGEKDKRRYRIEVTFDKNFEGPEIGTTKPTKLLTSFVHLTALKTLTTLPDFDPDNDYARYKEFNMTRYIDLNTNRLLKSSEVRKRLMADYTGTEINSNIFDPDKIYLEISTDPNDSTPTDPSKYRRAPIAELKDLGYGTVSPDHAITIRISRPQVQDRHEEHFKPYEDDDGTEHRFRVRGSNPRRTIVTEIIAHELGHAESEVLEPFAALLWSKIEDFFDGKAEHPPPSQEEHLPLVRGDIAKKKNDKIFNKIDNLRLVKRDKYPNPTIISTKLQELSDDEDLNEQLRAEFFMARTGAGHLRGSSTGQHSCEIEHEISKKLYLRINKDIQAGMPKDFRIDQFAEDPGADYCFLNLDDADLNPQNK